MNVLKVLAVQTGSGTEPAENTRRVQRLVAGAGPADVIVLPEVFGVRGAREDYHAAAEPIPGPLTDWLGALAREQDAWVLGGSLIESLDARFYNTSVLVRRDGSIAARYRKIHLFEATLEDGRTIRESDIYEAGSLPVLAEIEGWRCGLAVCYDLRFPELFRQYAAQGADLVFVPSNFTQRTGRDHWEVLLRARAIENQCFVVAPDQCGLNPRTGVASYGHSMVVGPWGEVLARAGDEEGVVRASLDPQALAATRARIPVLRHRRLA